MNRMDKQLLARIQLRDRIARRVISFGGISVILSVLLIMYLIVRTALPLFRPAEATAIRSLQIPTGSEAPLLVGIDDYRENLYFIDTRGNLTFCKVASSECESTPLAEEGETKSLLSASANGNHRITLHWDDGSISIEQIGFRGIFDADSNRTIQPDHEQIGIFAGNAAGDSVARWGDELAVRVSRSGADELAITHITRTEDFMGDMEEEISESTLSLPASDTPAVFTLSATGENLYVATGNLLSWYRLSEDDPELVSTATTADKASITSLAMLLGDTSLIVGEDSGAISTWFPVRDDNGLQLRLIHELEPHYQPIVAVAGSQRDKTVLSSDREGHITFNHTTAERHLLTVSPGPDLKSFSLSTRGNTLVTLTGTDRVTLWDIDNPHPEVSFTSLFGSVWYESYPKPDYVWQSSSASDDFEPKLSLTPLIFGTMKATFYAMIFAVPLALLAAVYTSQFCAPRLRQIIKPTIEVMAAVPSVVIGFLAALWLAPRVESGLIPLLLTILFLPLCGAAVIGLWYAVQRTPFLNHSGKGYETLTILPGILLAFFLALVIGPGLEQSLFDGSVQGWLFREWGIRYDQRNSIIIAFALGFAIIPIIFTIAEDALSNVPPSLKAASLALGASRWQTVARVILPSASPGIFAGIMIGLGRAVGETMIVLMATGNTAILDLSIFNGMRPLSANIAVEIPEAPVDGTLYRVLFLSAVILFTMTFILNTIAEVVRQRLRNKYGKFQ